jgi:hypothetical protein
MGLRIVAAVALQRARWCGAAARVVHGWRATPRPSDPSA